MSARLHLASFPLLQVAAMIGLWALPFLRVDWFLLFGFAVFILC